jgi:DNA-binding SARP family transcriptional activator/tetratricopeptide (TPR) repeat protein
MRSATAPSAPTEPLIQLRLLGALDLSGSDGQRVHSVLAQQKRLALLAYLAAATPRGFHRKDKLLALFWPESSTQRARDALRQVVAYLRRSLGATAVVGRGDDDLGLGEGTWWCDVTHFEDALDRGEWEEALALYRGDLLEGFHLPDALEFERWLDGERMRLRDRAAHAAWALSERAEIREDTANAVLWARRALELAPRGETTVRGLIALLDRAGDRAGAIQVYEEFARHLAEDFEADPSAETRSLIQSVRARQEPIRVGGNAATGPQVAAFTPSPVASPPSRADDSQQELAAPESTATRRLLSPPGRRLPRVPGWSLAVLLLVLITGGIIQAAEDGTGVGLVQERVLVTVLENQTNEPALDPLGRMASDWIGQQLARTGLVEVVPTMTALRIAHNLDEEDRSREGTARLRELAGATGAGTLVVGAYYREGDSLRFHVEVVDARHEKVVRSIPPVTGPAGAPLDAIGALGQHVTAALATRLNPKLTSREQAASQPPSLEAYQEYLAGADAFIRQDMPEAITRFHRAAAFDSSYTLPLLFAAFAHLGVGEYAAADTLARALERHRTRLVPLDRHHLDNIRAALRGDREGTLQSAREMVRLAPGSEWLYQLGYDAMQANRPREAVEALERIDPERWPMKGWLPYWVYLTNAHHLLGDHREELKAARRGSAMHPDQIRASLGEVQALAAQGREKEVRRLVDESLGMPRKGSYTPAYMMELAALELHAHGYSDAARPFVERALAWHRARPEVAGATESGRYDHARLLYLGERWEAAAALFGVLRAESPEKVRYLGYLGLIAVRRGDPAERKMIDEALRSIDAPYLHGENTYWRARIAALLGERERAVDLLAQSFAEGAPHGMMIHRTPEFETLRSHPSFRRLLRPKG